MPDRFLLRLNLHFFDDGDKTEKATPRKREKARGEGQVAKSNEIGTAFLFLTAFATLKAVGETMFRKLLSVFTFGAGLIPDVEAVFSPSYVTRLLTHLLAQALLIVAPLFAAVLAVGVLTNVAQVGWKVTTNALRPKFSRMNPISGAKRLFSAQILVDLCKSLLKFAIIGYVIYNALKRELDRLPALSDMGLFESVSYLGDLITSLGLTVGGWFILIAALDYAYTRFKHSKQLRMSKQEVKDEYKMSEGNPQIKGQIKQRMREASMRRMMQDVPGADVIVTNPTHYAVALRYDRQTARAPVVVAKGADHLARRIKEAGLEHHVAIAENKELARTLYVSVDVGHEIPPELYEAVAEILAFVYKLKHKGKGSL